MSIERLIGVLGAREFWISLFIAAYVFMAGLSFTPHTPKLAPLKNVLAPLGILLGIDQTWSLFSPDLRKINYYNIASITFKDGSVKLYEWPRMDRATLLQQLSNEKYRKMFIDCIPWPDYAVFLPSVARFLARANANPANPPVLIALSYFWSSIPPPEHWVNRDQLPQPNKFHTYYIYRVQAGDWP